jgi:hypothetical protein
MNKITIKTNSYLYFELSSKEVIFISKNFITYNDFFNKSFKQIMLFYSNYSNRKNAVISANKIHQDKFSFEYFPTSLGKEMSFTFAKYLRNFGKRNYNISC